MKDLFFEQYFFEDDNRFSIVIEDTGKATYAYLLENSSIISDLWLRNNNPTPKLVDWKNKTEMPFMNPEEYLILEKSIDLIGNESDINIKWSIPENSSAKVQAIIYIDETLIGVLRDGIKPGWSTLVKKDGPLARTFDKKLI